MTRLSLCLPYYRNPGMLAEQYRVWASSPPALHGVIEVVLVDDGSPEPAVDVPRPAGLPPLRLYRVLEDLPWHQHGARNLAAAVAESEWLFLTDIDHVLPESSLHRLLERLAEAGRTDVFTFARLDAPHLTPKLDKHGRPHPHPNSFALTKAHFWAVGGYDEDCRGYGTDGYFRQRLFAKRPAIHLEDIPIVRYAREVIPDANTPAPAGMTPKAFRDAARRTAEARRVAAAKAAEGRRPTVLAFEWIRVAL